MKTITLQGTQEQFNNLYQNVFDEDSIPQQVEIRVYVVDTHSLGSTPHWEVIDDIFMKLAENQGTVYTLEGFQSDFNTLGISSINTVIRFISVPIS